MLGALIVLLWPVSFDDFPKPEPLLAFLTLFGLWLVAEFKLGEEPTVVGPSENDIDTGADLLAVHTGELRLLLKDHNLWGPIDNGIFVRARRLGDRYERGELYFHNENLNVKLKEFVEKLSAFNGYVGLTTAPDLVGGRLMTGYKPLEIVTEELFARKQREAEEANDFASAAWGALDDLAREIRTLLP